MTRQTSANVSTYTICSVAMVRCYEIWPQCRLTYIGKYMYKKFLYVVVDCFTAAYVSTCMKKLLFFFCNVFILVKSRGILLKITQQKKLGNLYEVAGIQNLF